MARLAKNPYPGNWDFGGDLDDYFDRTKKQLDAIPSDKVIQFPIADGYAMYFIKSIRPLTLQHIPYGDAWQIPTAHMRGLKKADVEHMISREAGLKKLFADAKKRQQDEPFKSLSPVK